MTMPSADPLGIFHINNVDSELAPYLFVCEHRRRGHAHLAQRELASGASASALPSGARVLHTVDLGASVDVVAEADGTLVLLRTWREGGEAWASATCADRARAVAEAVRDAAVRPPEPGRVAVRFTSADSGTRTVRVRVRPWPEIAGLYPGSVRTALDSLVDHRPCDEEARRLLLWYGAPGTGKTTAVRALLHAWNAWADGVVVTDFERLLAQGWYLRRVVLNGSDDDRWRLIVLEDADPLLRRKSGGADLGKLLNLADGLLGQGLRCLFLITTNEPIDELHPALVRPGRCLARVEFGRLSAAETARLLGRPVDRGQTLAEVMAARPTVAESVEPAVGQYL